MQIFYNFFLCVLIIDKRTNDWPMIKSPLPGLTLIGLYLYFVNSWGPRFMKDRKPFQMQKTLIVYNFLQVLVSVYLFVEVSHKTPKKSQKKIIHENLFFAFIQGMNGGWLRHYSWRCQPVDTSTSDLGMRVSFYVHIKQLSSKGVEYCFLRNTKLV